MCHKVIPGIVNHLDVCMDKLELVDIDDVKLGSTLWLPRYYKTASPEAFPKAYKPEDWREICILSKGKYWTNDEWYVEWHFRNEFPSVNYIVKWDYFRKIAKLKCPCRPKKHRTITVNELWNLQPCDNGVLRALEIIRELGVSRDTPIDLYELLQNDKITNADATWIISRNRWVYPQHHEDRHKGKPDKECLLKCLEYEE